jgi:flagellum-specific ATP synthase
MLAGAEPLLARLEGGPLYRMAGQVVCVTGLSLEARGLVGSIGELCRLERRGDAPLLAEVVGFRGERLLLMPLGDAHGVAPGDRLWRTGQSARVPVGDGLLGRVLGPTGEPLDGRGALRPEGWVPVRQGAPPAMARRPIQQALATGVRAIDGALTCGQGQRLGIFAGSGVGKSTLLGMIARSTTAEVNVIGLIGERGREVQEFIQRDLGPAGLARSVVVVATSDAPPLLRRQAAMAATRLAEHYRDRGRAVLLMLDSLTRFAMAQREIGLASGEPPATRGYPPSAFAALPLLLERAGPGAGSGSITALYTVLVEGDDMSEPIADAARAILDGHIVLSRGLADRGQYPPVDILSSVSRLMPAVTSPEHLAGAHRLRAALGVLRDVEDLVRIGAYAHGSDPRADQALARQPAIADFLRQGVLEHAPFASTVARLERIWADATGGGRAGGAPEARA